MILIIRQWYCG